MDDTSAVEVAVKSASYNIILQVLMRVLSSVSNAVILRLISKDELGVINVRLMLLYSTCHCFSREAFRRSCLSKFDGKNPEKQFNLLWTIIPTSLICSAILRFVWLFMLETPESHLVSHYSTGVNAILLTVLIEIMAEPVYIFSQSFHFVKLKIFIEGISLTVKSLGMVLLLHIWPYHAIHSFCISQILGAIVYSFSYYIYFWNYFKMLKDSTNLVPINSVWNMFPKFSRNFVELKDLFLTWSFFKHTLLKQLLTEGERYLMTFLSVLSFAEQGMYDVVNNLGSLAARFVLLPIEESGYLLFTHLLSRDKPAHEQKNASTSLVVLINLLKLMCLLGLVILTFGFSYSQLLLLLYGGQTLSSGIALTLLRWHCVYVLFLALNGISEGFKFSVMKQHQIDRYNKVMVYLSVGFLITAFCLVKLFGGVGFILANCINMAFRIHHSLFYIKKYFMMSWTQLFSKVIPNPAVMLILGFSFLVTSISEANLCCSKGIQFWIWHFIIGICCVFITLLSIWFRERSLVLFIYEQWQNKAKSKSN
ncbi:protein RFT1 homolog [Uloborus diversus]|uniref:protein RFT1 homolog n=1 Tax=Uloborus diversus TaxID=327109 RepID=UPI002409B5F6|nr:protein RFT1 homolog [Uloborus diversus]